MINCFTNSFLELDKRLNDSEINDDESGCTLCVVVIDIKRNRIFSVNVGDSRAIVIQQYYQDLLKVKVITNDHKPDDIVESLRIQSNKGRIQKINNISRVYYNLENGPGLAMTRSIGD
jgi:serine/threonine protein phosphatase PrpC